MAFLQPIYVAGGSKSLFICHPKRQGTFELIKYPIEMFHTVLKFDFLKKKAYACGEGSNGRLGLGHSKNVSIPHQISPLSHNTWFVK